MPTIHDDEFGKITIRRSNKASQVKIRVTADGTLYASLPTYAPLFLVKHLIKNSRTELRKMLDNARPNYIYRDGMQIGKSHSLSIVEGTNDFSVSRHGQKITIKTPSQKALLNKKHDRQIRDAITEALRLEAKSYLPKRLKFLASKYGFSYNNVRFSHASGRWGSCSSNGTISLNIALMKLPFELIDYIIIHELAHTREMNHGPKFWQTVGNICPDYRKRRHALKEYSPAV